MIKREEKNLTLTGISKWLNDNFDTKKTGKPFTVQDAQQYVRLGKLPEYLGGYKIEKVDADYAKLYNIIIEEDINI